jgi:subtilisin family serine protease
VIRVLLHAAVVALGANLLAAHHPLQGQSKLDPRLRALMPSPATVPPGQTEVAFITPQVMQSARLLEVRLETGGRSSVRSLMQGRISNARLASLGILVTSRTDDIISAWIPLEALPELENDPAVSYVAASAELTVTSAGVAVARSMLDRALVESHVAQTRRLTGLSGRGVIVGIIDSGVDFTHADFIRPDGTTRIRALWDMSDAAGPAPPGFENSGGSYWTETQINAALIGAGFVRELDRNGHGTHVAGIAAGNGRQADGVVTAGTYTGVAPDAELVIVKATRSLTNGGTFQTADIVDALRFIDQTAASFGRPYVVNMSLGGLFGPHDGTNLEELVVDQLVGPGKMGKAIVIAAGNEAGERIHSELPLGSPVVRSLLLSNYSPFSAASSNFIVFDCWYPGSAVANVTVTTPLGQSIGPISTGSYGAGASNLFSATSSGGIYIDNAATGVSAQNGERELFIQLFGYSTTFTRTDLRPGTWNLTVSGGGGTMHCRMFRSLPAAFIPGHGDDHYTLGMPGTARNAITVGSYTSRNRWVDASGLTRTTNNTIGNIAPYSSIGPTRDGRLKPDIAAPGDHIISALSAVAAANFDISQRVSGRHLAITGTSMAAPHVAGLAALLFERDAVQSAEQLKQRLAAGARADGFAQGTPNPIWGAGKADVLEALRWGITIGDVNRDARVDVGDPITLVNALLGRVALTIEQKLAAELTIDGEMNVADVVGVANRVLSPLPLITAASRGNAQARVVVSGFEPGPTSALSIPLRLESPVPLAGAELEIDYATSALRLGLPVLDRRARGLQIQSADDGRKMHIVVWGNSREFLPRGQGVLLRIPIIESAMDGSASISQLRLVRVVMADPDGVLVQTTTASPVVAAQTLTVFPNRPNPLSAGTGTRFDVDIPQRGNTLGDVSAARVPLSAAARGTAADGGVIFSVRVYNVRGQLVRRVFDGVLPPGRFTVEWDGRGESGAALAPGLYYCEVVGGNSRERLRMILVN